MWSRAVRDPTGAWTSAAEMCKKIATGVRAFDPLKNRSMDFDAQGEPVRSWFLSVGYTDALSHIDDSVTAGLIQSGDVLVIPEFALGSAVSSMGADRLTPLLARMLGDGFPMSEIITSQSFARMMDLIVSKTDAGTKFSDLWNDERA